MKKQIVRFLLAVLNSRWLNHTPCQYGFIGNVDAFSLTNLESEERQRPGITVRTVLEEAARFRSCSMRPGGLIVLEGADKPREATIWDRHDLSQSFAPQSSIAPSDDDLDKASGPGGIPRNES